MGVALGRGETAAEGAPAPAGLGTAAGVGKASMNATSPALIHTAIMRKGSPREAAPTWLVGSKVRLRPIEPDDVPTLQRWINTSPARNFIFTRLPMSLEQERDWAANAAVNPNTPVYIIQTSDGVDIGSAGLQIEGARATLGIAIHDERFWNRGLGSDAVSTLVDGAFRARPLTRIELTVFPDNERAIRAYERVGFQREGLLRRYVYQNGAFRDVVLMSILHEEWTAAHSPQKRARATKRKRSRKAR
jgi:RimJ/RimL family protein N-acetyltransferase